MKIDIDYSFLIHLSKDNSFGLLLEQPCCVPLYLTFDSHQMLQSDTTKLGVLQQKLLMNTKSHHVIYPNHTPLLCHWPSK